MSKSFFKSQFITILAHICAWGIFFFIPFYVDENPAMSSPPFTNENFPIAGKTVVITLLIVVFYINYLVLVPQVLNRRGTRYYLGSILILALAFISIIFIVVKNIKGIPLQLPPIVFIFPFTIIMALSLAIRLLKDRNQLAQEAKERENETLKSELSFLRSQISPHFLFNIMNNIIALSRLKPEMVEPSLIKLSQLMRYMLYNSDEKKVHMDKEIEYLESYIDLQKLRFGDVININFNKNEDNENQNNRGQYIEPMLLIPFVENAFKHGSGFVPIPSINIDLKIINSQLLFQVVNKYNPNSKEIKDADSGIGLKNVSRRLELLYGKNHYLNINTDEGTFSVQLSLTLN